MRFWKIWWNSWWWLGELSEVPRCLLWRALRHHYPLYLVSSSINVFIFHIAWLVTFWTDLVCFLFFIIVLPPFLSLIDTAFRFGWFYLPYIISSIPLHYIFPIKCWLLLEATYIDSSSMLFLLFFLVGGGKILYRWFCVFLFTSQLEH